MNNLPDVTDVLDILKNNFPTDFPTSGVLAGQSVAEAYLQAIGSNIVTRMKDLDVFIQVDDDYKSVRQNYVLKLA